MGGSLTLNSRDPLPPLAKLKHFQKCDTAKASSILLVWHSQADQTGLISIQLTRGLRNDSFPRMFVTGGQIRRFIHIRVPPSHSQFPLKTCKTCHVSSRKFLAQKWRYSGEYVMSHLRKDKLPKSLFYLLVFAHLAQFLGSGQSTFGGKTCVD